MKYAPDTEDLQLFLKGQSIPSVARRAGIRREAAWRILHGRRYPMLNTAAVLAKAIGCSIDDLWLFVHARALRQDRPPIASLVNFLPPAERAEAVRRLRRLWSRSPVVFERVLKNMQARSQSS